MARAGLLLVLALVACSGEQLPDLGGRPAWHPVDLGAAMDLGHVATRQGGPGGELRFRDASGELGLDGVRAGGNSHGVGVAFLDLDGDEYPEIFIAAGKPSGASRGWPSLLLQNQAGASFRDVTQSSGVSALASVDTFSVGAGDYDRDGDVDLYVGALPTDILLRNEGGLRFTDATAGAGAGGPPSEVGLARDGRSKVVAFGDYDGDGWLDLVSASSTLERPFAYLLRNTGDGRFTDVTAEAGVFAHANGNPCAVLWSDYDNDADPDLHIWNDRGDHVLLRNDGGRFSDVTQASLLDRVGIQHPMGIDAADIDRDGDLDYYVSNIGNNPLLQNSGDGRFTDITGEAGTEGEYGWGLAFQDFDLDGHMDIFVAQEDDRPALLFRNLGESPARFAERELPHPPVVDAGAAHNVPAAFADYDRDGRMDALLAWTDGSRITVYRNESEISGRAHLEVHVRGGPGGEGGVGARVLVMTPDALLFRDVTGGSSRASQNELAVAFGLGEWSGAQWVAVQRPSGEQRVFQNVPAGRLVVDLR